MKRLLLLIPVLIFTGCRYFHHQSYKRIGPDLYFRLITLGDDTRKPEVGDYITVSLLYATETDSVFFEGTRKFRLEESPFPGAINEAFLRLSRGDSASVFLPAASFFENTLRRDLPSFIHEGEEMRVDMRLLEVQTEAEFRREKTMFLTWAKELHSSEAEQISRFLKREKLNATLTDDGYYFLPLVKGTGRKVEKGRHIYIQYEGRFLNGKYFDSTVRRNEPVDFIYGSDYIVIKGLDKALARMHEGGKALVILPSDQAFGPEGSIAGIVPPWTSLVYELEVLKVE